MLDAASEAGAGKLRNIEANPRANLNLNCKGKGGGVVRVECDAEVLDGAPSAAEVSPYPEKYREGTGRIGFDPEGFARNYSVTIRAIPTRWRVW